MYRIEFDNDVFVAHTKQELLDLWSKLLFYRSGMHYKIVDVYDNNNSIVCGFMSKEHFRDLEKIKEHKMTCENGACTIDFGGTSDEE